MYHRYENFVEVIAGSMYAGKSTELIRRIETLGYTNLKIVAFKPSIDNRYSEDEIVTHSGMKVKSHSVSKMDHLIELAKDADVVAIDEIQFFDTEILKVIDMLAKRGVRVIVAGLDTDFRGEAFPTVASLMATSEFVTKLVAICTVCGGPATRSQRLVDGEPAQYSSEIIQIGGEESYEARCRKHHII